MPSVRTYFTGPRLLLALWAAGLFSLSFAIFERHHHFPFFYHPDEPGKVEQVLTHDWNFHHPMLLLNATRLAVKFCGVPKEPQAIVEAGRTVSAAFMALAVVALSLTAYLWRGWTPAVIAGVALATHHQLYELAHYLKEDSALLAGVSVACLAVLWFAQAPSPRRAALLGIGCGLAISGKYVGVVTLGLALPVLWAAGPEGRARRLGIFGLGLFGVLVLVNLPLIVDLLRAPATGTLHRSFAGEMDEVVHGQGSMTRRIPHLLYWNIFLDNSSPVVWLLLVALLSHRRPAHTLEQRAERWLVLFPFAFGLLLSFSPKENDRYFLPASALFMLLAGWEPCGASLWGTRGGVLWHGPPGAKDDARPAAGHSLGDSPESSGRSAHRLDVHQAGLSRMTGLYRGRHRRAGEMDAQNAAAGRRGGGRQPRRSARSCAQKAPPPAQGSVPQTLLWRS